MFWDICVFCNLWDELLKTLCFVLFTHCVPFSAMDALPELGFSPMARFWWVYETLSGLSFMVYAFWDSFHTILFYAPDSSCWRSHHCWKGFQFIFYFLFIDLYLCLHGKELWLYISYLEIAWDILTIHFLVFYI